MITAQDIENKAFERAGKGYNMEQVDEFLDELAAAFTAMSKENASLKGKMKMLVQKVDEYRETEDSMRLALLSAQKLSSQIEAEAREKADSVVAEAQQYAERLTRDATDGIANEEAKLEEAKKATNRFFDHMRTVCEKQIEFYDKLSQMQLIGGADKQPEPEPEPEEPAEPEPGPAKPVDVEETVRSIAASAAEAALDEPEPEPEQPAEPEPEPEPEPAAPEPEEEPTRLFPAGSKKNRKNRRSFDDFSFDEDI